MMPGITHNGHQRLSNRRTSPRQRCHSCHWPLSAAEGATSAPAVGAEFSMSTTSTSISVVSLVLSR